MAYQILLIDDDRDFRKEFRDYFYDLKVLEAANSREAIKILQKPHQIDLIILDEMLSCERGTQILPEIRSAAPRVGVMILTGYGSTDVAAEALRGQAVDFLEKPLNKRKLQLIRSRINSSFLSKEPQAPDEVERKIEKARLFALRNYDKKLTLNDVAAIVHLSPKYFSRLFKKRTGFSFSEYRLSVRVEKSKELLKKSGQSIDQISYSLGYKNTESFIRIFKMFCGQTPHSFRQKSKKKKKNIRILPDKGVLSSIYTHLQEEKKRLIKDKKTLGQKKQILQKVNRKLKEEKEYIEVQKSERDHLIRKKTKELKATKQQLRKEKHLSEIGKLASVIAHELRNPLGTIQTALYNIRQKTRNKKLYGHLNRIEKKIDESEQIIKGLLHYARILAPAHQEISLYPLIVECIKTRRQRFKKKRVRISQDLNILKKKKIQADALQMRQVFNNILNNAFQAISSSGGHIKITARRHRKSALKIDIQDNGKGIDPLEKDRVFELFYSRRPQGTGLGLAVCKQLVELHKGQISIRSQKGKGAAVTIFLPLRKRRKLSRF